MANVTNMIILEGSRSTDSAPKTPYTTRQLEKEASTTRGLLKERAYSPLPLLEARFDKIIKSHELALNERIFSREEIRKYIAKEDWKGQKRKRSDRQPPLIEGPPV